VDQRQPAARASPQQRPANAIHHGVRSKALALLAASGS